MDYLTGKYFTIERKASEFLRTKSPNGFIGRNSERIVRAGFLTLAIAMVMGFLLLIKEVFLSNKIPGYEISVKVSSEPGSSVASVNGRNYTASSQYINILGFKDKKLVVDESYDTSAGVEEMVGKINELVTNRLFYDILIIFTGSKGIGSSLVSEKLSVIDVRHPNPKNPNIVQLQRLFKSLLDADPSDQYIWVFDCKKSDVKSDIIGQDNISYSNE